MRNLSLILFLVACVFGLSAEAEVLLLEESQLGQDLYLRDATKLEEKNVSGCDYWTELFDPVALDYKITCLAYGSFEGSGVAKEFEKASTSWIKDLNTWSDSEENMPDYDNAAFDLDKHYLQVYEEAEHQIARNAEQNWMLMNQKDIQKNAIKEILGERFGGQNVLNSNDPTADLKALMKEAEAMGANYRAREQKFHMPGEIVEDMKAQKIKRLPGSMNGYIGNGIIK